MQFDLDFGISEMWWNAKDCSAPAGGIGVAGAFHAGAGGRAGLAAGNRKNRPGDRPDGVRVIRVDGGGNCAGGGEGINSLK